MPNYPVPSNKRIPWDKDGTVALWYAIGVMVLQATDAQKAALNSEVLLGSNAYNGGSDFGHNYHPLGGDGGFSNFCCLVFPHPRDITDVKIWGNTATTIVPLNPVPEYSTDTTNGIDGTWSTLTGLYLDWESEWAGGKVPSPVIPVYRENDSAIASNVRGLRLNFPDMPTFNGNVLNQWHVYGDYSSGANPDRLEIWKPSTDAEIDPGTFDWGDIPRNSSAQKTFRVKNRSATLTAHGVVLSFEQNTAMVPSQAGWHQFSTDGSTWASTINIGDLAPGALSPVLYVRRVTPANAQLSLGSLRMNAHPGSWS